MVVLSLLPAVGSALVWGPAAAWLLIIGDYGKGITLIFIGVFVIGLIDNILRPILVGRDTQMPDYLVLISTLGGISLFGLSGFVMGPVLAALFLVIWQIFMEEYKPKESERQ
jgi:predicted PurR-regulated permease PerM